MKRAMNRPRLISAATIVAAVLTLILAPPAPAQEPTAAGPTGELRPFVADRLVSDAVLYLRAIEAPEPADYRVAALVLESASNLRPEDPEILRHLVEAWHNAGDRDRSIDATRRLVRLDPADTVALLRLVSARVRELQNAEDRQRAYDRLLAEGADALDPSVRSRLALDSALLAREAGEEDRFVDRLSLATRLDPTNKSAAALASMYTLSRVADPMSRVEMLANVVLADPLDGAAHHQLAEELLTHGAHDGARRFFRHARRLYLDSGDLAAADTIRGQILLTGWAIEGAGPMLDNLIELESVLRNQVRKEREAATKAGEDPESVTPYRPDRISLTLRLAIASALGDTEEAAETLEQIEAEVVARLESLQSPADGSEPDPAYIRSELRREVRLTLWSRLWTGVGLEEAAETIASLEERAIEGEPVEFFRGLLAAQLGDREEAERLLTPLAESDSRARVGLAIAAERVGDRDTAMYRLARLALDEPGTMLGVWARERLQTLLGRPVVMSATARSLEAYAASLPDTIDTMVREPRTLLDIHAAQPRENLRPFDPVLVELTLRNVGPTPLALGDSAPIATSVLVAPRVTIGVRDAAEQLLPEIVSLNRRLRLAPGEAVRITARADLGRLGQINDRAALTSALFRFRVTQNFVIGPEGEHAAGARSVTAETGVARRTPIALPTGGIFNLPNLVRESSGRRLAESAMLAFNLMFVRQAQPNNENVRALITATAQAFADRLAAADRFERAMLVRLLPRVEAFTELADTIAKLRDDADRVVRLTYLFNRVESGDDPIFEKSEHSGDAVIAEVATRLREQFRRRAGAAADAAAEK